MATLKIEGLTLTVSLAENIAASLSRFKTGWVADVQIDSLPDYKLSAIAVDQGSAKSVAIVLARHACEQNGLPCPDFKNAKWSD